jgi:hypothetical protein
MLGHARFHLRLDAWVQADDARLAACCKRRWSVTIARVRRPDAIDHCVIWD